jgi:hypothetical protein
MDVKRIQNFGLKTLKKEHFEDTNVNEGIFLKLHLNQWSFDYWLNIYMAQER